MPTDTLQRDSICTFRRGRVSIVYYFSNVSPIGCIYFKILAYHIKIISSLLRDLFCFLFTSSFFVCIDRVGNLACFQSEIILKLKIMHTADGIPWTEDQPGAWPLPTQDNSNRINADNHALRGITWSFLSLYSTDSLRSVVNIVHKIRIFCPKVSVILCFHALIQMKPRQTASGWGEITSELISPSWTDGITEMKPDDCITWLQRVSNYCLAWIQFQPLCCCCRSPY